MIHTTVTPVGILKLERDQQELESVGSGPATVSKFQVEGSDRWGRPWVHVVHRAERMAGVREGRGWKERPSS